MSIKTKIQFFAVFLCLIPIVSFGSISDKAQIRVATYNLNGLPWPLKENKKELYQEMAVKLNERRLQGTHPQVVLFQEGFTNGVKKNIVKNLKYPFYVKGPNAVLQNPAEKKMCKRRGAPSRRRSKPSGCSHLLNSGLHILSDYEIVQSNVISFGGEKYGGCVGWDCMANKSVVHVRIYVPELGREIDIFNTHLNAVAGAGAKEKAIFESQTSQINTLMEFVRVNTLPKNPYIIAGDFNIKPNYGQQAYLDSVLPFDHAGYYCFQNDSCEIGEGTSEEIVTFDAIDYQYFRPADDLLIYPIKVHRDFDHYVKERPLSDHLSFEVTYELQAK